MIMVGIRIGIRVKGRVILIVAVRGIAYMYRLVVFPRCAGATHANNNKNNSNSMNTHNNSSNSNNSNNSISVYCVRV